MAGDCVLVHLAAGGEGSMSADWHVTDAGVKSMCCVYVRMCRWPRWSSVLNEPTLKHSTHVQYMPTH